MGIQVNVALRGKDYDLMDSLVSALDGVIINDRSATPEPIVIHSSLLVEGSRDPLLVYIVRQRDLAAFPMVRLPNTDWYRPDARSGEFLEFSRTFWSFPICRPGRIYYEKTRLHLGALIPKSSGFLSFAHQVVTKSRKLYPKLDARLHAGASAESALNNGFDLVSS